MTESPNSMTVKLVPELDWLKTNEIIRGIVRDNLRRYGLWLEKQGLLEEAVEGVDERSVYELADEFLEEQG